METGKRTWNFFIGPPNLTTEQFPDDLDTTSLALSILPTSPDIAASVMDEIVSRQNQDGIVPVCHHKLFLSDPECLLESV
jgi:hypothetical protein